jgi:hypothetical protein
MGNGQMRNVVMSLVEIGGAVYTQVDAAGKIKFDLAESARYEPVGPAQVDVVLLAVDGTYTVDYSVSGGTADIGTDYNLSSGTLTFNPGESRKTIEIALVNDSLNEEDETVEISLSGATGPDAYIGGPATHTLTILDPRPLVAFETAGGRVPLDTQTGGVIAVVLDNDVFVNTVTVNYAVTGGTATGGGVDYTLAAGTLTFSPGQTVKTINAGIVDDGDYSDMGETVELELTNAANSHLGFVTVHTVTITDPRVELAFVVR